MKKTFIKFALILSFIFAIGGLESCKTKSPSNKYRTAKTRTSEKQLQADKKAIAKNNKNYKKKMRQSRKHLFGRKTDPGAPKK